jgi:membrane protein DedA with SNARE-associated domain
MLTHLIQSSGYLAVFILMALESACIPIPSEVTMPFAGFLANSGTLDVRVVVLLGAVGNLVGSLVAYYIGYFLEETVLLGWIQRYGKYVLVREADYHRSALWFQKYGNATVFFSRLLPAVRTFISLPAGAFRMNVWTFSFYTFAGSLIWSALLAWFGYTLGSQWDTIEQFMRPFQYIVVALVLILACYFLYRRMRSE